MRYLKIVMSVFLIAAISGCGGGVSYVKPGTITYSSGFSDTDLKIMSEKMVQEIISSGILKAHTAPPKVALLFIKNETSEYINTDVILDKIMVALINSGKFSFVDRKIIDKIAEEQGIREKGYYNLNTSRTIAKLAGADYFLVGSLASMEQATGSKEFTWYRLSLRFVRVNDGVIVWAGEAELKKKRTKGLLHEW